MVAGTIILMFVAKLVITVVMQRLNFNKIFITDDKEKPNKLATDESAGSLK